MSIALSIEQFVPRLPEYRGEQPISLSIDKGENGALIGPNGAGKTLITDIIQGKLLPREGRLTLTADSEKPHYQLIKSMSFRDIYSLTDCREMYYQQRWNSFNQEEVPIVRSLLKNIPEEKIEQYASFFHIEELLDKRIISLSSGELRKFLITKTLMSEPELLILDNPFIGLDAQSRESLNQLLQQMVHLNGLQILLVLSHPKDLPLWLDYVVPVIQRNCLEKLTPKAFLADQELIEHLFPKVTDTAIRLPEATKSAQHYDTIIQMKDVCVKYDTHTLLKNISWQVNYEEKWALLGENGSGKSTLLSLVCGDNPQAYANNILLFDQKRGSGESIWDIKKRIGYLSPDMHTYYLEDIPCVHVVASGFFDSVGLFRKCDERQKQLALEWMKTLACEHLSQRSFVKISYGEQRLVLLARAFVKSPELLILDEPLHGLDAGKKELAKKVIETYCGQSGKTLIYVTHYEEEIPTCITQRKTLVKQPKEN